VPHTYRRDGADPQHRGGVSAVAWGLTAALLWGASALVLARPARTLGARTTLAWTMAIGAAAVLPVALIVDGAPTAPADEWAWAIVAGVGFVVGSGCWLLGVRLGDVSVVTPIVATDGAIAAVIAIATGEVLGAATLVSLGIVASGVVLVCLQPRHANVTTPPAAVFAALGAAVAFGIVFTASGRTVALGALWTVAVSRVVGAALSVPPEAFRRHVPPRWTLPWLAAAALLDAGGFAAIVKGAGEGVAVASVLASQYAVVAVVGGVLLYRERLTRRQATGVALTLIGVAGVAIARG
jgi:drug/metabolite transporter (DMT)-like permease